LQFSHLKEAYTIFTGNNNREAGTTIPAIYLFETSLCKYRRSLFLNDSDVDMSRERVIVDIETLEQALKVEQTIRTGYTNPMAENIVQWIAVEEDLANSYHKIAARSDSRQLMEALRELEEESRHNITLLQPVLESLERFAEERIRREKLIEHLMQNA
jgi:hypothetical protein